MCLQFCEMNRNITTRSKTLDVNSGYLFWRHFICLKVLYFEGKILSYRYRTYVYMVILRYIQRWKKQPPLQFLFIASLRFLFDNQNILNKQNLMYSKDNNALINED